MFAMRKNDIFIIIFIIVSTCSVYAQVLNYDFINYDDDEYITENEFVKKGITEESVVRALTEFHSANWHPLTWLSHMIDCQLFGLNAGRHHLINLIFHVFNSVLLYVVFRMMTGKIWQSGFVAALFALHPLHVESVAWISERKDMLSTFFMMLTLLSYFWYTRKRKMIYFYFVILFYLCGLMSKSMLVTLPFVLLLLDLWPLKRFHFQSTNFSLTDFFIPKRLLIEKIPLFILSALSCLITIFAQRSEEAIVSLAQIPLLERIANAFVSYSAYIYKTIYPVNLSVLYPYNGMPPLLEIVGSVFLIIFISFISIRTMRSRPYLIVGWLWFLGTLVPVIGFIQAGSQSMADRYTYIPLIGLFLIISWGVSGLFSDWRYKKIFFSLSSSIVLIIFSLMTSRQAAYWENGLTISQRAIRVTSDNWLMENNLANMLVARGEFKKGISHYFASLLIKPDNDLAYNNLKRVLSNMANNQSVAETMESAVTKKLDVPVVYFIAGKMFRDEDNIERAIAYFEKTIQLDKQFVAAYYELSPLYVLNNELEKSLIILNQLVRLDPDSPIPYSRIFRIYQMMGNEALSLKWYQIAEDKGYQIR
jgi:tetratricopeptide (TPR) repeat protein